MRQIKFRAWNKKQKIMVYQNEDDSADYWDGAYGSTIEIINENLDDENYEMMQFTGLLDKNGKEIYEGDILKFGNYPLEVIWDMGGWEVKMENGHSLLFTQLYGYINDGEIIGNIYEHPHILSLTA